MDRHLIIFMRILCLNILIYIQAGSAVNKCIRQLGVANSDIIPDHRLRASDGEAAHARLNNVVAWTSQLPLYPERNETNPEFAWIEVNFGSLQYITGIQTKGDQTTGEYVATFSLLFSKDCHDFTGILDASNDNVVMTFHNGHEADIEYTNFLPRLTLAQCLRVVPLTTSKKGSPAALRFEVLGCVDVHTCKNKLLYHMTSDPKPKGINAPRETDNESKEMTNRTTTRNTLDLNEASSTITRRNNPNVFSTFTTSDMVLKTTNPSVSTPENIGPKTTPSNLENTNFHSSTSTTSSTTSTSKELPRTETTNRYERGRTDGATSQSMATSTISSISDTLRTTSSSTQNTVSHTSVPTTTHYDTTRSYPANIQTTKRETTTYVQRDSTASDPSTTPDTNNEGYINTAPTFLSNTRADFHFHHSMQVRGFVVSTPPERGNWFDDSSKTLIFGHSQNCDVYNVKVYFVFTKSPGITLSISGQTAVIQFEETREARCVFIQSASYKQTVLLPLVRIYFIGCDKNEDNCRPSPIHHLIDSNENSLRNNAVVLPRPDEKHGPSNTHLDNAKSNTSNTVNTVSESKLVEIPELTLRPTKVKGTMAQFKFNVEQVVFGVAIESYRGIKWIGSRDKYISIAFSRNCFNFTRVWYSMADALKQDGFLWKYSETALIIQFPVPMLTHCVRIYSSSAKQKFLLKTVKIQFLGCGLFDDVEPESLNKCGRKAHKQRQKRVIGGGPIEMNHWPWLVSLQLGDYVKGFQHVCGGTLVHPRVIMTAAHCIHAMYIYQFPERKIPRNESIWNSAELRQYIRVAIGDHHLWQMDGTDMHSAVERVIIHERFNISYYLNDIAILELTTEVPLTDHANLVCLPESGDTNLLLNQKEPCTIVGWGTSRKGYPLIPNEAQIPLVGREMCDRNYSHLSIKEYMICGGTSEKDACSGDSGGPLMCHLDDHWVQVGIASWSIGCAKPGFPGVYAKVEFFLTWIANTLAKLT